MAGIVSDLVVVGAKDLPNNRGYRTMSVALQSGDEGTNSFIRAWQHGNQHQQTKQGVDLNN